MTGIEKNAHDADRWFAALYDGHRGLMFSTALRLCGRHADAEDLTAEAFLRAYRAARGYAPGRRAAVAPRAWLLTILVNLWRNQGRASGRKPPPGPLEHHADVADPSMDVPASAERRETGAELAALLGLLPPAQREAVVLRHVVDLPIAEVAHILGVPQGTAKSHVSRGLSRLRTLLREGGR